ncbi:hypothetical protein [Hyalangium versicolor]|uniref:hypothetical protein n=1 Tax=Hyalangium versicolor TaxID=2861190 RepID=UPI001CCAA596|nr:hypothetical protein [Hyalangium versicolor]
MSERAASVGPAYFDLAVRATQGQGVSVYRFQRSSQRLTLLERVIEADVAKRVVAFQRVQDARDAIIVLSPEGPKKPNPPTPGGDDPPRWLVPEAEYNAALKQLKALEPKVAEISIGQLASVSANSVQSQSQAK